MRKEVKINIVHVVHFSTTLLNFAGQPHSPK
jgi:hypothetical protein